MPALDLWQPVPAPPLSQLAVITTSKMNILLRQFQQLADAKKREREESYTAEREHKVQRPDGAAARAAADSDHPGPSR